MITKRICGFSIPFRAWYRTVSAGGASASQVAVYRRISTPGVRTSWKAPAPAWMAEELRSDPVQGLVPDRVRGRGVRVPGRRVQEDLPTRGAAELEGARAGLDVGEAQEPDDVVGVGGVDRPFEGRRCVAREAPHVESGRVVPRPVRLEHEAEPDQ